MSDDLGLKFNVGDKVRTTRDYHWWTGHDIPKGTSGKVVGKTAYVWIVEFPTIPGKQFPYSFIDGYELRKVGGKRASETQERLHTVEAAAKNLLEAAEMFDKIAHHENVEVWEWDSAYEMLQVTARQMKQALDSKTPDE